ncbi:MAG: diguanylate cyclase [Candidatus Methylophosphatis roskildensis]
MLPNIFRCVLLLLLLAAAPARATTPTLVLDGDDAIDAWPAVTMLADPGGALTLAQVLARRAEFVIPEAPHANLGVRREAVWLRVPLQVAAGGPTRWVLSVDYASIDRIELHLLGGTHPPLNVSLGRTLPFSQRAWPSSWHAATLDLEPGQIYELILRVQTTSTMVVPLTLSTPERFHAREARAQVLQGLMAGAALCLLLYSLTQWVGLRDAMFLHYSLTLAGTTVFFIAYFGLGPQHLWGDNAWLTTRAAPLAILLGGLVGGFLFIDQALRVREIRPWISRGLRACAAVSALIGVLFAVGLVDYRFAQIGATLLGPLPMLLAIPAAWVRARCGERIGVYMLVGWGVYGLGTLTMVGMLRGYMPSNFWTQHAFQFGSLFEMVMWMCVLGVRIEDLRASAQRAHFERDALRSLAHTDALTGLPNRRGLNEALARVLAGCAPERLAAVFLLDLDGFKSVNDRFGHDAGDELLIGVARRLESLVRASDLVARLGGDEFVVVADALPGDAEARALGQKLLEAVREPFVAAGQCCRVGITIGYALAPLDGRDALGLLKRADAAMYAGTQAGRCCLRRGAASVGLVGA